MGSWQSLARRTPNDTQTRDRQTGTLMVNTPAPDKVNQFQPEKDFERGVPCGPLSYESVGCWVGPFLCRSACIVERSLEGRQ